MDLYKAFDIIDLYEEEATMNASLFIKYLEKNLVEIVSSTKELSITIEDGSLGKVVVVHYKNKNKEGSDISTVEFKISIVGFNKNGKSTKDGVKTFFDYIDKDKDVKAMKTIRGTPRIVADKIKDYFKSNVKNLTKYNDKIGRSEFKDTSEEVVGTATPAIAIHTGLLGINDGKKLQKRKIHSKTS